MAFESTEFMSV